MMRYLLAALLIIFGGHLVAEHLAANKSTATEVLYLRQQQAANQRDINQLNDWYFEMRERMREQEKIWMRFFR